MNATATRIDAAIAQAEPFGADDCNWGDYAERARALTELLPKLCEGLDKDAEAEVYRHAEAIFAILGPRFGDVWVG